MRTCWYQYMAKLAFHAVLPDCTLRQLCVTSILRFATEGSLLRNMPSPADTSPCQQSRPPTAIAVMCRCFERSSPHAPTASPSWRQTPWQTTASALRSWMRSWSRMTPLLEIPPVSTAPGPPLQSSPARTTAGARARSSPRHSPRCALAAHSAQHGPSVLEPAALLMCGSAGRKPATVVGPSRGSPPARLICTPAGTTTWPHRCTRCNGLAWLLELTNSTSHA